MNPQAYELRMRAQEEERKGNEAEREAAVIWENMMTLASRHKRTVARAIRHRESAMDLMEAAGAAAASDRMGRRRPGGH